MTILENGSNHCVFLAPESRLPDRDLVPAARLKIGWAQVLASKGDFAAIVPSTVFGTEARVRRRLVLLIDRSGSMDGVPMQQAGRLHSFVASIKPEWVEAA